MPLTTNSTYIKLLLIGYFKFYSTTILQALLISIFMIATGTLNGQV